MKAIADVKYIAANGTAETSGVATKHPFISRVEIRNFRNFNDFAVDLAPTAVIVGENKAGKSNFLDALRLVLDPSLPDSARVLRSEDFWDGLDHSFDGHKITVKIFIQDFENNDGAKAILSDCIVLSTPLTAKLTYTFRPIPKFQKATGAEEQQAQLTEDDYDFVVFGGDDETNLIGSEVRKWFTLVILPALRDVEGEIQNWRKSPLRPLLEKVRKQIPAEHLEAVRQMLDTAKATLLKAAPVAELLKAVNLRVRSLAGPIHSVTTDFDFASSDPGQLIKSLRLFLQEKASRPLSDASLGTANILFLALLLQDMDMKQQAHELVSTVLAIEEPEAHLHPQLQRLLFRYFLSRNRPVLLTTHSPHIASVSPVASIILLRKTDSETKGFTSRALSLDQKQIADLQRYLDVTRAEMLFARGIIFVEGVAEQFLVPVYASAYMQAKGIGSSLDDLGISVCSVNGADFFPFRRLVSEVGLSIPNVVITDGDPRDVKGKSRKAGLQRGIRLITNEKERGLLQSDFEAFKEGEVYEGLAKRGIFVGGHTLEIDLVGTTSNAMKETYAEICKSPNASKAFDTAIDNGGDPASRQEILNRIETVGKGRFAQRLADKVAKLPPPPYIQFAIAYALKLTSGNHAAPPK